MYGNEFTGEEWIFCRREYRACQKAAFYTICNSILPRQEMKQLELHGQDICTSFPIPIIPREELERTLAQEPTSI